MHSGKLVRTLLAAILLVLLAAPTAVFAGFEGKGNAGASQTAVYQQDDEEAAAQEGTGDGVGVTMGLLAGVIFLIIAVVAVVGAVGLGIIGIGYWQSTSSEE